MDNLLSVFRWVLEQILPPALAASCIGAIFMLWAKHSLDRKLEAIRSALQDVRDRERIAFESLHERRAETIADLYAKMMDFLDAGAKAQVLNQAKYWDEYEAVWRELRTMIRQRRLWFPEQLATDLWGFVADFDACILESRAWSMDKDLKHDSTRKAFAENQGRLRERFKELEQTLLPKVDAAFRKCLRVEDNI